MIPRLASPGRSGAALLAGLLLVTACGGSDSDTSDPAPDPASDPVVTTEPTGDPEPDATTATDDAADAANDTGSDTEPDTATTGSDAGSESASTTTVIEPDPSADLPTARPDQTAPATTVPGPLPVPSIQLIPEAIYDQPLDTTIRPGDVRMIVMQKGGEVIAADAESSLTLFDIGDVAAANGVEFRADGGEQGLLGIAYHPVQPLVYAHFSGGEGETVVAEIATDEAGAVTDPSTYRELLRVVQPFSNHNGGELEFGPDGLLYLALGDGGSADDPERASLDLSTPLGSILRFDPTPSGDAPITVPADNPLVDVDGADPLIWAWGLRNPWKFSFDSVTGDLWIADVGQNEFEEINRAPADDAGLNAGRGLDFGWSAFEAYEPFNDDQSSPDHTPPVAAYSHSNGACSVSGGVVARDSSYADLNGWYVYGDFCSGQLWALDTTSIPADPSPGSQPTIVEIGNVPGLTSVTAGPDGDIYAVSIVGDVFRLAPA